MVTRLDITLAFSVKSAFFMEDTVFISKKYEYMLQSVHEFALSVITVVPKVTYFMLAREVEKRRFFPPLALVLGTANPGRIEIVRFLQ
jgi:hypothetical protein